MGYVPVIETSEREDLTITARIVRPEDGRPLTRGEITSWELRVFDKGSETPVTSLYTLTGQSPATVFYDTPQFNDAWKFKKGFNHAFTLADQDLTAAGFTRQGGKTYMVEHRVNRPAPRGPIDSRLRWVIIPSSTQ